MAYPTDLDDFTTVENGNTITAAMFNTPSLAIEALEAEVGVDGTAAESLRYKCDNFFVAATHVFFAQATPPTGWTTDSAHKDNVLACKSDAGTYSTVGADKGSFTYTGMTNAAEAAHTHTGPSHSHSHSHKWYDSQAGATEDDKDGAGTSLQTIGTQAKNNLAFYIPNISIGSVAAGVSAPNTDMYTDTDATAGGTGNTGAGVSHNHTITHDGTDRPKATVGVIATYTGA